jgi:hypothetical protein
VIDVRLPKKRLRPDHRLVRKTYDHDRLEAARQRAWLESTRYRVTL